MEVLPRGRHSLTPEDVVDSQRGRMMRAVALAVAEKGYGETVVTDVIERARVSRKTFYEQFDDLQDCFRQAHAAACATLIDLMEGLVKAAPQEGLEPLRAGLGGYLAFVASEPELTQAFFADAVAAGPGVARQRNRTFEILAGVIVEAYERARAQDPSLPEPYPLAGVAATGATLEIVLSALAEERLDELPGRADEFFDIQMGILTARGARGS